MSSFYSLLKASKQFSYEAGLFYQVDFYRNNSFEKNYLALRRKEGRLYEDDVASRLPEFKGNVKLSSEWKIRKRSAMRLVHHLQQKSHTQIMEIGCGNGWLIRHLQEHIAAEYLGIDINEYELKQAVRISGNRPSLFLYGDVYSEALSSLRTDTIIVASAANYFPDLKLLIQRLFRFLTTKGEIHIIDTPFYNETEAVEAKIRSEKYFQKMQADLNGKNYYHHSLTALKSFQYEIAYRPHSVINQLKRKIVADSPFPWIVIKKPKDE